MTKTAATKKATAHLRYGWYRSSGSSGWVTCPECRRKVHAQWPAWETGAKERKARLVEHLMGDCEE
jgi:hypothetical protein